MKTVFSNTDQCIHVWAQQNQPRGRNSTSSVSFEGDTLVSYSTPIARIIPDKKGRLVALHYCGKYSVTTSAQQSTAWGATSQYPRFSVKFLGVNFGRGRAPRQETTDLHKENLISYGQRYAALVEKLSRARSSSNMDWYKNDCRVIKAEAQEYCKAFGVRFTPSLFPEPDADGLEHIREQIKKKEAAKKAADKKREAEIYEGMQNNITEFLRGAHTQLHWNWKKYATPSQITAVPYVAVQRWKKGDHLRIHDIAEGVFLRKKNEDTIETSQGAEFPASHAKKAWPYIRACREKGNSWHTNGHTIKLGSFGIEEINIVGDVRAGCHCVKYDEIESMAKQLGLA